MNLTGTRKWCSSNASYACDYGGGYAGASSLGGLLWVCSRTKVEIPALVGRQASLQVAASWQPNEFPWMLPNAYESYVHRALEINGPVALLDHRCEVGYSEILITSPGQAIEVLEVVQLPSNVEIARLIGQNQPPPHTATSPDIVIDQHTAVIHIPIREARLSIRFI